MTTDPAYWTQAAEWTAALYMLGVAAGATVARLRLRRMWRR